MKLTGFIRDRMPRYLISALTSVLVLIFLCTFHVKAEAVIIVGALAAAGGAAAELWEFLRRRSFYDKLAKNLEQLDQKYLLTEMLEEPDFLDGRLLYTALQETDKSMCERIAEYRRENQDFREYIELWVHEIKLPVASLQLMCHNDGNVRYSEPLKRIDHYIESVLYYARSGSAEKDYIIKPVLLKRAFADVAVRDREVLQEHDISISTAGLDTEVLTDAKWLSFIFGQLTDNSIKYEASEISVSAEVLPDSTVLHFRDNGIGIPAGDLTRIFEKSFTGENGRTHTRSTGMGLYIVKKLCDKLGHSVSADSVQGEYTDIIISFGRNELYKPE